MKLQWLGHSSFRLTESTGTTIVTDPFDSDTVGYPMPPVECDVVTTSLNAPGYNCISSVGGNPVVFNDVTANDVKGVHIQSVSADADGNENGIIFKFRLDGVSVCHMGALKGECSAEIVEELVPVNVLLIPVGGNGLTMDAETAKEYVDNIMPDIVIPMSFKTKNTELDVDKVDDFLRLFDENQIVMAEDNTIEFDRYDFDGATTRVIVPKRLKH